MKSGIFKLVLIVVTLLCGFDKVVAQEKATVDYQRGSVIIMMIEHPMYLYNEEIAETFKRLSVPERFNDHGLGVKVVKFATQEFVDQQKYIESFIEQSNLGSRAVAKWFCWDKNTGAFSMDLIKSRGMYNATALDRELASLQVRGSAILADAGVNLIPNTYLIMNDICYKGKYGVREVDKRNKKSYKKFDVEITSYIFQLDWDNDDLNHFYAQYYEGMPHFVNDVEDYGFKFRAKVKTKYGEGDKNILQSDLIEQVVARCLDINLVKLQRALPDFKIKSVVTSAEPFQSAIGMKEGVEEGCLFEVLEMNADENGIVTYKRVGIVKPIADKIWDNRYVVGGEVVKGVTTFEVVRGGNFYPGMLIREIEN